MTNLQMPRRDTTRLAPLAAIVAAIVVATSIASCARTPTPDANVGVSPRDRRPVLALVHARWLGPSGFEPRTMYVVNGRLRTARPTAIDSTIDLTGEYVVPPFAEAHNHNLEYASPGRTDSLIARYLHDGVFYVKNPGNLPRGRDSLAGRIFVPDGVDVAFANGLLTATGGHPTGLYKRNLARGAMTVADGDGGFLWLIDSLPDLERKWPRILAGHPDFIKVILVHSEEFARRRLDTAYFNWKGLDPALVPEVVRRAHAAKLRVSAHVETAADFHNALVGGVDEINHTPGFRGDEHARMPDPSIFVVDPADARLAARRAVVVVTTLGGAVYYDTQGPDSLLRRRFDSLHVRNLRTLRDAGVHLALGSDTYRDDSVGEARYLATLGVFDNLSLVRLWSEATPRAIFPTRRVGCLDDGCEASLLALGGDPSVEFNKVFDIRLRVKDGMLLSR